MQDKPRFAVVTGANRGIGRAVTERLVTDGYHVAGCTRTPSDELNELLDQDQGHLVVPLDLSDEASISAAARTVLGWSKQINALVNCAGIASGGLFSMTRMDDLRELYQINTFGPLFFTQYLARAMVRSQHGAIVNIGSTAGLLGDPGTMAYGGSKAALMHATRVLASELGGSGIRVNAIAPAVVETDMAQQMQPEARAELDARSHLPGTILVEDVAATVAFLVSDQSSKLTGQIVRLDRGMPF
ncbi:MAG: SDR family oxidoreductase [Pseudomonadota bacterium]